MASRNNIHSTEPSFSWKGEISDFKLSHKMCPRKQTTEPKLLISVSFFLRRRYLIHWYQLVQLHIVERMPFCFYWAILYVCSSVCFTAFFCLHNDWEILQLAIIQMTENHYIWCKLAIFKHYEAWIISSSIYIHNMINNHFSKYSQEKKIPFNFCRMKFKDFKWNLAKIIFWICFHK